MGGPRSRSARPKPSCSSTSRLWCKTRTLGLWRSRIFGARPGLLGLPYSRGRPEGRPPAARDLRPRPRAPRRRGPAHGVKRLAFITHRALRPDEGRRDRGPTTAPHSSALRQSSAKPSTSSNAFRTSPQRSPGNDAMIGPRRSRSTARFHSGLRTHALGTPSSGVSGTSKARPRVCVESGTTGTSDSEREGKRICLPRTSTGRRLSGCSKRNQRMSPRESLAKARRGSASDPGAGLPARSRPIDSVVVDRPIRTACGPGVPGVALRVRRGHEVRIFDDLEPHLDALAFESGDALLESDGLTANGSTHCHRGHGSPQPSAAPRSTQGRQGIDSDVRGRWVASAYYRGNTGA